MSDTENQLRAVLDEWNAALDAGDIDRLVATADPDVVICNEKTQHSVGADALRAKYAPRMELMSFQSKSDILDIKVFGDFAVMVLTFDVEMTNKQTGDKRNGKGRLVLGYKRNEKGEWKLVLDVDNNGPPEA